MRWLGLDIGSARIGVALGDDDGGIASPWSVIDARSWESAKEEIVHVMEKESVDGLVIGIPKPLHDQERMTDQAKEIEERAVDLEALGLPVERENETLSSAQAATWQRERGQSGKRDDLAACAILQTFLDRRRLQA